jgi:hypothetical protein
VRMRTKTSKREAKNTTGQKETKRDRTRELQIIGEQETVKDYLRNRALAVHSQAEILTNKLAGGKVPEHEGKLTITARRLTTSCAFKAGQWRVSSELVASHFSCSRREKRYKKVGE